MSDQQQPAPQSYGQPSGQQATAQPAGQQVPQSASGQPAGQQIPQPGFAQPTQANAGQYGQPAQTAPGQYAQAYQPAPNQYGQQPYQQGYQQPQVVVMNQQTSTQPTGNKAYVNKINYILFAIILGSFGAQFFYSGKVGAGVACVIFCWTCIPAIIGLIMGIAAAFKDSDDNGCIYV